MKVYIAGRFTGRERLSMEAGVLEACGFDVVSTWLTSQEKNGDTPVLSNEIRRDFAIRDINEVMSCDLLILDTRDESTTGGREVELGMAIAWNKRVAIVGPQLNVFHWTPGIVYFDNWDELHNSYGRLP